MLRWSVSLFVLVSMLAASSDLMAQRRQPLRNIIRSIGSGWGTGNHYNNPGPRVDYYSPYSQQNIPSYQNTPTPASSIIPGATITPGDTTGNRWNPNIQNGTNSTLNIRRRQDGSIIYKGQQPTQPTRIQPTDTTTQWFDETNPRQTIPNTGQQKIQSNTIDANTIKTNTQINRYMKPYHGQKPSSQAITIQPESNWKPIQQTPNGSQGNPR